jgi:hypothetical protein
MSLGERSESESSGGLNMSDNRYATAGWLAIIAAILFPTGFVVGIIQGIIGIRAFNYHGPITGPSDLIFIVVTIIGVYVLVMLRRMFNERYGFHDIDVLITIAIWWNVFFQVTGLALKVLTLFSWPASEFVMTVVLLSYMIIAMLTIGVIDILIAIKLIRCKERFSDLIKAYAYITVVSGISEVLIFLMPLALILVPVNFVILGMIFLKEKEEVEFV